MSRFKDRVDFDTGYADGHVFLPASAAQVVSGTFALTRNAAGDFSLNAGASQTGVLVFPLESLIFRYGLQDNYYGQFGSAQAGGAQGLPVGGYTTLTTSSASAGSNVNIAVKNSAKFTVGRAVLAGTQKTTITAIPDSTHITVAQLTATLNSGSIITENLFTTPADVTGVPPYPGTTQFTPVTSPRPKGIALRQIFPVYAISGAAATLNTISITQTTFTPGNAANVVTTLLASGANGLGTATNANPYTTPIQVGTTTSYLNAKYTSTQIEWDVSTTTGGAANLYGIFLDILFNLN